MEELLTKSKNALTHLNDFKKIIVVLGNETCDLDSAICTLVHALYHHNTAIHNNENEKVVIPVLNISKKQLNIKTDVIYHLELNKIPLELLTFRDEIDLFELNERQNLALSLVDHHALSDGDAPLVTSVIEVIDHRPQDPNWPWTACDINLKKVGSCATLVTQNILEKNPQLLDRHISKLLMGVSSPVENRYKVYSELLKAKCDIQRLTPLNILEKDLKYVNGVPIAGLPLLVEKFLNLNGALEAVTLFTRAQKCRLTVVLGMNLIGDVMARDCAVFSFLPNDLENKIIMALLEYNDGELALSLSSTISENNWCLKLYKQANVQATRKQILPIIQRASAGWQC